MAGICYSASPYQILAPMRVRGVQCCSSAPSSKRRGTQTPKFLRVAVSGVTELLRLFSPPDKDRLDTVNDKSKDETLVSDIDDILMIIKSDYENAYFVTGLFTSQIYADDCTFEDPTIKFQGKDLYSRNLKLLVPFFDNPSIKLKNIEKKSKVQTFRTTTPLIQHKTRSTGAEALLIEGINSTTDRVVASWKLRTYLKLPWRPRISVDGTTIYDLDEQLRVVRHVESWSISALEAIAQIFTPSFGRYDE